MLILVNNISSESSHLRPLTVVMAVYYFLFEDIRLGLFSMLCLIIFLSSQISYTRSNIYGMY